MPGDPVTASDLSLEAAAIVQAGSNQTLVDQIVSAYQARIAQGLMRAGTRLTSIREFARQQKVSRFTVVEAYDRLVARGYIESRRGSGFYVRSRQSGVSANAVHGWAETPSPQIDVVWLLRNMFKRLPADKMPGAGVLPAQWLDAELINRTVRALGRQNNAALLDYGHPQGYLPLREQLHAQLARVEISAQPEAIVTTSGATAALDIIAQHYLRAGDTVLVDEPSWFVLFGRFATLGVRVVGVPRQPDGHDPQHLEALMREHTPRLFVTTSVLHNPTGSSMSSARAYQLLRLAEQYDVVVVEDDVYSDLHPGPALTPSTRLAALDGLRRVIYIGGFSKTLAASLRVGYIATTPDLARKLTDLKMLLALTTGELSERAVYQVLSEGHYRRHLARLRQQLDAAREPAMRLLEGLGLPLFVEPAAGMYVWADLGVDANQVTQAMLNQGYLMAPGSLFMPDQRSSSRMRFNIATSVNPAMIQALEQTLGNTLTPVRGSPPNC